MRIRDYLQDDGTYKDSEGCSHDNAEDFLCSILGFCGCGQPEAALEHVRQSLRIIHDLKEKVWEKTETYDSWNARMRALMHTNGIEYFTYFFLDDKGFLEHGGSVPGWLTPEGEDMLADLDEWAADPYGDWPGQKPGPADK